MCCFNIVRARMCLVSADRPRIAVTVIGEYIRHHACERRFKLDLQGRRHEATLPFATRLFNPLDPVLQAAGQRREDELANELVAAGLIDLRADEADNSANLSLADLIIRIADLEPGTLAFARQVEVEADIGAFRLVGNIDFVLINWNDGVPRLRLVECKASRRDHTYQHVQVALYRMLVRSQLTDSIDIECVVARIDENTNQMMPLATLPPLNLATIEDDIEHLLASGGTLDRIACTDLDSLPFQIDSKCDDCRFNVNCLPESARQRRIELLGVEPSAIRVLASESITRLDDLALLDHASDAGLRIQATPGFGHNLEQLTAQARSRITTLPGGRLNPDDYQVETLPFAWESQLPEHTMPWGERLVRVYLEVNFDYVENRIGALAAHVTCSAGQIHTPFSFSEAGGSREPIVQERYPEYAEDGTISTYTYEDISGVDVVKLVTEPWPSATADAAAVERTLIESFFQCLTQALLEVAGTNMAPIHFYVWDAGEMTRLIEACARSDSRLLGHLHQLLGCRESLEQLIFSALGEEVDRRYALGWTGRGLSVVTSLTWFGRRYHWNRIIDGEIVQLDHVFEQDIFDFKTTLAQRADGSWADDEDAAPTRHRFEIRSRFRDTLKAPYWRAYWGDLPDKDAIRDSRTRAAIERYERAASPGYLDAYLRARVHALRWVEENIRFKNRDIEKPPMDLEELADFSLGVDSVRAAAIDFLKLDQHVSVRTWVGEHLLPPGGRVGRGRTIPLARVMPSTDRTLVATIDLSRYGMQLEDLASVCSFGEDDFVRLAEHPDGTPTSSHKLGQLFYGSTCIIKRLDWETGDVELSVVWAKANHYQLASFGNDDRCMLFATLNESVSEFVGGRVEGRLDSGPGAHIDRWLDQTKPRLPSQVPLDKITMKRLRALLESIRLGGDVGYDSSQIAAILDGLMTRVQALQGPPGTGKTTTTALAVLTRILARRNTGDIVLIGANTHTAVDTLLSAIERLLPEFERQVEAHGLRIPFISLAKVHSSKPPIATGGIGAVGADRPLTPVQNMTKESVAILGGTTSAILKMAGNLNKGAKFQRIPDGFQTPLLVVDEASMMVFPHFLALATLVAPDGEIMLAGDQRQLAPIVAHDWDNEDRPPVKIYQPHVSAIEMVQLLADHPDVPDEAIRRSALDYTFRLPGIVRELVARLYLLDEIELRGLEADRHLPPTSASCHDWEWIWQQPTGLFLVVHDERESRQNNPLEVEIIRRILASANRLPDGSVAIVTPHRAQRTLLKHGLAAYVDGPVDVIDVVEKLQGNERPTIIISGTASDPAAISATAEFILGLNRSNVAFSRAKERLIVVCSQTLLNHIAADFDVYGEAMLWKSLRELCSHEVAHDTLNGHTVRVRVPAIERGRTAALVAD